MSFYCEKLEGFIGLSGDSTMGTPWRLLYLSFWIFITQIIFFHSISTLIFGPRIYTPSFIFDGRMQLKLGTWNLAQMLSALCSLKKIFFKLYCFWDFLLMSAFLIKILYLLYYLSITVFFIFLYYLLSRLTQILFIVDVKWCK